ncbi:uncharacterized protein K444DRAFT_612833 [Hyaloscypha bicolor E]|uniref:Uncharacterized protein n=1 Tax=Hyaloscypha bicolor E TaxID=1095630 RepID=A0A2J6TB74_9HELO|nr:uncharacterized protein K444DRAFT_612833 [Hyaloscypha bicolor E]PMD60243.1 hypothetical protein K444DRAFT_612833 [Hyaloscypha bicolor E]
MEMGMGIGTTAFNIDALRLDESQTKELGKEVREFCALKSSDQPITRDMAKNLMIELCYRNGVADKYWSKHPPDIPSEETIEKTIIQMILNTSSVSNSAIGIGNQSRRPYAEEPSSSRSRRRSDKAVLSSEAQQPACQQSNHRTTIAKDGKAMVKRRAGKRPEYEPLWDSSGEVPMNHAAREVVRLRTLAAEDEEEDEGMFRLESASQIR